MSDRKRSRCLPLSYVIRTLGESRLASKVRFTPGRAGRGA